MLYTSYCSRFSLLNFARRLFSQTSLSNEIIQSESIYILLKNLPHFALISFVFVKFFYLFIEQFQCRCCGQSTNLVNHNKNEKVHPVSLVSSIQSIDLVQPDYQTKPEFYYTQGKLSEKELISH